MFRHVNDPNFGLDTTIFDQEIERARQSAIAAAKDGVSPSFVEREMVLRSVYESSFGIRNHFSGKQRPLAMVAANPKEDYAPYSSRYRDVVAFIEERVHEATGLSMDEFFRRPRADIELIFAAVKQSNKKRAELLNGVTSASN